MDWVLLQKSITLKDLDDLSWLVACADTLSDLNASTEMSYLLFELLNIKHIKVTIAALDSIRSNFVDIYSYYTDDQKHIIRQIVSSLGHDLDKIDHLIVDEFKAKLLER